MIPFEPVAIVGQSCVLPGALTPAELWQAVASGKNLITQAKEGSWGADTGAFLASPQGNTIPEDKAWHSLGGYVRGFESVFKQDEYSLEPEFVEQLDPLFKWVLHTGKMALEGQSHRQQKTGAVIGNLSYPTRSFNRYAQLVWCPLSNTDTPHPLNRFMSGYPAALLAKALDLSGPAYCIDAACASSLYAIKLACDALQHGRADIMLAGGVNAIDDLFSHVGFTSLGALSPSGQSRPFHNEADGLIPATGAAFVTLKRLRDAEADGDAILGVVKGIGLSNDGRAGGLLNPAASGQIRAMRSAYQMSGIEPASVSLIECHATGTKIGDGIELESLSELYQGCSDVPIGSLKSNLGHLVTAAGIASVIKVIGAMQANLRPPSIGTDVLLPQIKRSPFRLLQQAEPWDIPGLKRAAISAFGFGGNNAHMLMEAYQPSSGQTPGVSPSMDLSSHPVNDVPARQVAIVGMGIRVGNLKGVKEVARAWFNRDCQLQQDDNGYTQAKASTIELDCLQSGFPPKDLEQVLPQQLMAMAVCSEAIQSSANDLDTERTSVLMGMGTDPEAARYVARMQIPNRIENRNTNLRQHIKDVISPPLNATRTLGCMPNIVANRVSTAFNFKGPSYTFSSEELSGIDALNTAIHALQNFEIDAALVAAVDLCCEPVHRSAAAACLPQRKQASSDAGVCLVMKRLGDANKSGDTIYAVLDADAINVDHQQATQAQNAVVIDSDQITRVFGHAHAASGLLQIALSALCVYHQALPSSQGALPLGLVNAGDDPHMVQTDVVSFTGRSASIRLKRMVKRRAKKFIKRKQRAISPIAGTPHLFCYDAQNRSALIETLSHSEITTGHHHHYRRQNNNPVRLAIVAHDAQELKLKKDQAVTLLRRSHSIKNYCLLPGIYYADKPLSGKLGFTFPASAGAYSGMGRDLLLSYPDILEALFERVSNRESIQKAAAWIYEEPKETARIPLFDKLKGSFFLSQAHSIFSQDILKLQPDGFIGFSAGEKAALFAADVWHDMGYYYIQVALKGVWTQHLGGDFKVLDKAWGDAPVAKTWTNWNVRAPYEQVQQALTNEPLVHLATINTSEDFTICGQAEACERVVGRIGPNKCHRIYYDIIQHAPEMDSYKDAWNQLNTRRIHRKDIQFYGALNQGQPYTPDSQTVRDSLWRSARHPIDFPAIIHAAYNDGIRIFVEHGPRSSCTSYTQQILRDKEHLAVAFDGPKRNGIEQLLCACAQLYVVGVEFDRSSLHAEASFAQHIPASNTNSQKSFPAHGARVDLSQFFESQGNVFERPQVERTRQTPLETNTSMQPMPAAPELYPALYAYTETAHRDPEPTRQPATLRSEPIGVENTQLPHGSPEKQQLSAMHTDKLHRAKRPPHGPAFNRKQLQVHGSGSISSLFGKAFLQQDGYALQVRMPEEPLLLADRVIGIDAKAGSLGTGTIWTETDVTPDAWYLHHGHMPPGIMIEAGQADLFLISYMGIDFKNKGERAYRLLGCNVTYMDDLPRPGDTLHYQIQIDRHAGSGGIHLFFFHFEGYIGDKQVIRMRGGHAGFFTNQELSETKGLFWVPEDVDLDPSYRLDKPMVECTKTQFRRDELEAFSQGRLVDCFGDAFCFANTHTRTPTIAQGKQLLIEEITDFHITGGPWKRGYLRGTRKISADDWFFTGHFKNDPCMPGTLMTDMAFQGLAIYMAALGFTLEKDGWTFRPVRNEEIKLLCRSQVTPTSKELALEIFIREAFAGESPTIYADVLFTVDGAKTFHAQCMSLSLTVDYPNPLRQSLTAQMQAGLSKEVALVGGIPCDEKQASDCAWGRPSEAFGYKFARFDQGRRLARLPGAPYNFISRIRHIVGEYCGMQSGTKLVSEWDVPNDCIFYGENGYPTLPYAVIVEAALQPCGWLGCYLGCPLAYDNELVFRNLDGTLTLYREVIPGGSTLRCEVENTNISKSGGSIIVSFKVAGFMDDKKLLDLTTVFGYFSADTMAEQVGLRTTVEEKKQLRQTSDYRFDFRHKPNPFLSGSLKLAGKKLLMLDRISGYWPNQGKASLGVIRGEKTVDSNEWFFKAHFFQDPVQPGSLGLEAMLQLLQFYMIENNLAKDMRNPRFEPLALNVPVTWRYRGQVTPKNRLIETMVEIVEIGADDIGPYVMCEASLWCDGLKIYDAKNMGMRIAESAVASVLANSNFLDRPQLEQHAEGKLKRVRDLSNVYDLDPAIRLPRPPFLLFDRVTEFSFSPKLDARQLPAIALEWDIKQDEWYLDHGHLCPALLFESPGQASTLLCSVYSGITNSGITNSGVTNSDVINGESAHRHHQPRSFRALSLKGIQYYHSLPKAEATLHYTVKCTNIISFGKTDLFYFSYQCRHNHVLLAEVEQAIVGLLPAGELQKNKNVAAPTDKVQHKQLTDVIEKPVAIPKSSHFDTEKIRAFANGDGYSCFGHGFETLQNHQNPPRLPKDDMALYIDEVLEFDSVGGPLKQGYLKAKKIISPNEWFFKAHFKDDPCMPAALIAKGCFQVLSFYLAACGYTLDKDHHRFVPIYREAFDYEGEEQITPEHSMIHYDLFVERMTKGQQPSVKGQVIVTADEQMIAKITLGVQLIPSATYDIPSDNTFDTHVLLPQFDPKPEERLRRLEKLRKKFRFDLSVLDDVPLSENIPEEAKAGQGWNFKIINKLDQIRKNWEKTIEKNNYLFEKPLPEKTIIDVMQMLKDGDLLTYIEFTNPDLGVALKDKRPQRFEEYYELFQRFPVPKGSKILYDNEEFADYFIGGLNPLLIENVSTLKENYALTDQCIADNPLFADESIERIMADGRMFVVDYIDLSSISPGRHPDQAKYIYRPTVFLAVPGNSENLELLAIQNGQSVDSLVITPQSGKWDLLVAKTMVKIADINYHELLSHLGVNHLLIEPIVIASYRQLSAQHPLHVLLIPHFEGTLPINALAIKRLLARDGRIEQLLAGKIEDSYALISEKRNNFHFRDNFLRSNVECRGVCCSSKLEHYPYRDDGLLIWDAIETWCRDYVDLYYRSDNDVIDDYELAAWAEEIMSPKKGRIIGFAPDEGITTKRLLIETLTMIIFTATAHHSAINYPQEKAAAVPYQPLSGYQPKPEHTGLTEAEAAEFLPPLDRAMKQTSVLVLLGQIYYTQLGKYDKNYFTDKNVLPKLEKFQASLKDIEEEIKRRNTKRRIKYAYLMPSQITQSINI